MAPVKRRLIAAGIVLAPMTLATRAAFALTLDEARNAGYVGELPSGYVGVVVAAAGVQTLVDSVNAKRRQEYEEIARANGVPLAVIEQEAAQQLIGRAQPGWYVGDGAGGWRRK
jgi:uncharacterized protein YdbL (DUF1318 family)